MTIVYVDTILLENLCMNYLILRGASIIIKQNNNKKRIFLAAFIGGLYSVFAYMFMYKSILNIIVKIIMSVLIVKIAFNNSNNKELLKNIIIFYITSFLFGGFALGWTFFFNTNKFNINERSYRINASLCGIIISGIIGIILLEIGIKIFRKQENNKIYKIKLYKEKNQIDVKAFLDTGNKLKSPSTNESLIIVEKEYIEKLYGMKMKDILEETNIRIVPYKSLGKEYGVIWCVKINKVIFLESKEEKNNIYIGIYDGKINKDNEYQALIGPGILEGS